jgi:hypothetical protein
MVQTFVDFVLERLMPLFQFREVRLHRHAECLLNQWLEALQLYLKTAAEATENPSARYGGGNPSP